MKRKLKLFQRMETLKKKDILKDKHHSLLIEQEILKTKSLLEKIDLIISENSQSDEIKFSSGAVFKNKSNLIGKLNEQKNIAKNKKEFLVDQNKIFNLSIAKKSKDKNKINQKYKQKLNEYNEELENKNSIYFKKNNIL